MRYDNAELMQLLGAEYVLGTLRGRARRRFEQLLETHAEARHQVEFWKLRLSEFDQIAAVAPPPGVRAGLLQRATTAVPLVVQAATPAPPVRHRRRSVRWAWSYAAGFATAAGLMVAFLLGQQNAVPDLHPGAGLHTASTADFPFYAAQLRMPASSMQWLLSKSADHRELSVLAADDFLQLGRHHLLLWGSAADEAPVLLGALPIERDMTVTFTVPDSLRGRQDVRFAISLEPETRPGNGSPSGPVLNEIVVLDGI